MKEFYILYNVGTVKCLLNFHDGVKTHEDGSPFYDVRIFTNQKKLNKAVTALKKDGYTER